MTASARTRPNGSGRVRLNGSGPRPSFLFLRRFPGERIVVFDDISEAWITVLAIDADTEEAVFEVTGLDAPLKLNLHGSAPFLQGAGRIKLHTIQEYENQGAYVSVGVHAPRSMLIRREELIKGTTRAFRASLARR